MTSLAAMFQAKHAGDPRSTGDDAAIEAALRSLAQQGHAAFPDVALGLDALAAWLGERAPPDGPPALWIAALRPGDAYLACACAEGLPAALRAFDAVFLDRMDAYLATLRAPREIVDETRQEMRTKLFVGEPDAAPRIRQYAGQGALEGWVRIAAIRTAVRLLARENAARPRADEALALAQAAGGDPELDFVKAKYRDAFRDALREAVAALSQRDRVLLRLRFVEQASPGRIGIMYRVHRTTATRWIDAAQEAILTGTRSRLMERLRLSPSECTSVIAALKSRIDLTLASLLA